MSISYINMNMNIHSNSTVPRGNIEYVLSVIHDGRDRRCVYAIIAATVTALALSAFTGGNKLLLRIWWFLDRMLGGAPHDITLPGPPGYPLSGNLFEASLAHPNSHLSNRSLQMKNGHIQKIAEWTKKYGDVIRVSLGEREAVRSLSWRRCG